MTDRQRRWKLEELEEERRQLREAVEKYRERVERKGELDTSEQVWARRVEDSLAQCEREIERLEPETIESST